jgi:hypothetical protein
VIRPALVLTLTLALAATALAKLPDHAKLTQKGLGPVKVGMTEKEVEAAIGHRIEVHYFPGSDCGSAKLRGKVFGLFTGPTLARVSLYGGKFSTKSGLRVGDPESAIREHYGNRAKRSPHAYDRNGHYFKVTRGNRRISFETDGDVITQIHGGRIPEVDYIEGCA